MKKQNQLKKAIDLRRQGYSFDEIHKLLSISKSTSYVWLKNVKMTPAGQARIRARQHAGREKGQLKNHLRAVRRDGQITRNITEELSGLKLDDVIIKLLCAMLYWGEGAKGQHRMVFTNSDPRMVKTFLKLFRHSFELDESRFQASLHLHEHHQEDVQKKFWSGVTNIPTQKIGIYRKPNSGTRKRRDYPGCISIRYNDVNIGHTLEALYKIFSERHGGVV